LEVAVIKKYNFLLLVVISVLLLISNGFGQDVLWTPTKNPVEFFVNNLVSTSQGKIFVSSDLHGILKLDEESSEWFQCNDDLPETAIFSMVINSQDIIFASALDGYFYRSSDLGESWDVFGDLDNLHTLYVHSDDMLYAGTHGAIYVSNDNGDSWIYLPVPFTSPFKIRINSLGNIFYISSYEVWASYDNGATFELVFELPGNALDMLIDDFDNIYIGGIAGLYKSEDHGQNFSQVVNGPDTQAPITTLAKDSHGNIFAGDFDRHVWMRESNGDSFQSINDGWGFGPISALLPGTENELFVGTANIGIMHTTDMGGNWEQMNDGLNELSPHYIFIVNDYLFAGASRSPGPGNDGLFRSTDFGEEWTHAEHDGSFYYNLIEKDGQLFLATMVEVLGLIPKLHRSDDYGNNWIQIGEGLPLFDWQIESMAYTSSGEMYAVAGFNPYISIDNGDSWEILSTRPTDPGLRSVLITSNDYIFLGGDGGNVHRSTDNGVSWETFSTTIQPDFIVEYIVSRQDDILIVVAPMYGAISRSTDFGETWENVDIDFEVPILSINYDNSGQLYVTSSSSGVFVSQNDGDDWVDLNDGLPVSPEHVRKLAIRDINDIYITTLEGGIYHGLLEWDPTHTDNDPNTDSNFHLALEQNYPNPFNPSTTIEFDLPKTSEVTLKIFNILGEEIATLVSDRLTAGNYSYEWDAGNMSSGVYLYRLEAGEYVETLKMVLMR
jgi:photosystem II stability/assembly factor-like uncharacterized protein